MMKDKAGGFAAKHPGRVPDPLLAEAVREGARDGSYPCAAAEDLARRLGVPLSEVGVTLDLLEIRIGRCQLGLFGRLDRPRQDRPVAPDLEEAIQTALEGGRLTCAAAWAVAAACRVSRREVGEACESLGIKIKACQLGAF